MFRSEKVQLIKVDDEELQLNTFYIIMAHLFCVHAKTPFSLNKMWKKEKVIISRFFK